MVAPVQPITKPPPMFKRWVDRNTEPHMLVSQRTPTAFYYVVDINADVQSDKLMAFCRSRSRAEAHQWALTSAPLLKRNLRIVSPPTADGGVRLTFNEIWQTTMPFKNKPQSPGWGEF